LASTEIVDHRENSRYHSLMLAPEQSRAARAWLDWSQEDLAKKAQVSLSTIRDFEKGRRTPIKNNLDAIRLALEMAGVSLLFRGEIALGVQVARPDA
jgi:DNA-binding XRE family transcriptional regulator